jgi:hypothetical protein
VYVTFRDVHKKTNEHMNFPHTRNEEISTDFDHETNHSLSLQVCSVIPPQKLHNQNLDYFTPLRTSVLFLVNAIVCRGFYYDLTESYFVRFSVLRFPEMCVGMGSGHSVHDMSVYREVDDVMDLFVRQYTIKTRVCSY